jgi:hypothetical protein
MKRMAWWIGLAAILVVGASALGQEAMSAQKAFEKAQVLVGAWEAKRDGGGVIRLEYKMMSSNSVLVENFKTPSGKETLSVYHMDGERLLLTHYCAQGNQPRLMFDAKQSSPQRLVFTFLDATNLASPEKSHMVRLEARFLDGDHFDQASTYRTGKEEEASTLHFARVSTAPSK